MKNIALLLMALTALPLGTAVPAPSTLGVHVERQGSNVVYRLGRHVTLASIGNALKELRSLGGGVRVPVRAQPNVQLGDLLRATRVMAEAGLTNVVVEVYMFGPKWGADCTNSFTVNIVIDGSLSRDIEVLGGGD